jgi:hypothetical protein
MTTEYPMKAFYLTTEEYCNLLCAVTMEVYKFDGEWHPEDIGVNIETVSQTISATFSWYAAHRRTKSLSTGGA